MSCTRVTRTIVAPIDVVFTTVADANQFARAVPMKVELLTDKKTGVGTRYRSTRLMNGKESTMEFEVTEFLPNVRVRIVNETHGTVWDSVFGVKPDDERTVLTLTMEATSDKLIRLVMVFLFSTMVKKALERDMDSVKAFCER